MPRSPPTATPCWPSTSTAHSPAGTPSHSPGFATPATSPAATSPKPNGATASATAPTDPPALPPADLQSGWVFASLHGIRRTRTRLSGLEGFASGGGGPRWSAARRPAYGRPCPRCQGRANHRARLVEQDLASGLANVAEDRGFGPLRAVNPTRFPVHNAWFDDDRRAWFRRAFGRRRPRRRGLNGSD